MAISNLSPWGLFKESFEAYPDNIMIISNAGELSYSQVFSSVQHFCGLIEGLEFRNGGIYLPNCVEFISCMLALNKQRKVVVPLSYQLKGDTLFELMNFSDIDLVITDERGFVELNNGIDRLKLGAAFVLQADGGFKFYEFSAKNNNETYEANHNTFCICFTSGSTSKPKGIVLSNQAIAGNALAVAEHLKFTSRDKTIIPRSFAQASPISGDILMTISKGGSIIILNDLFHPAIFLKAIQDYKATNVFMIRTMLTQVLEYPHIKNFDLSSMKRIMLGGMSNPGSIFSQAMQKMPDTGFYNAYGLSEVSARVSFADPEDMVKYAGSIGRPMKGCNLMVYREDGSLAEPEEVGEIYVKSDYVMDGYYKATELTLQTLTDKGVRTRDLGYYDKDGMFYIVGRNDDLIIQAGNKVYPGEIEEVLIKNPLITEAVVFGVDDEILGKKIVALVRISQGCKMERHEIYKWCRSNLEDKKIPKDVHVVEVIPRNAIGKISRNELRAIYKNLLSV